MRLVLTNESEIYHVRKQRGLHVKIQNILVFTSSSGMLSQNSILDYVFTNHEYIFSTQPLLILILTSGC